MSDASAKNTKEKTPRVEVRADGLTLTLKALERPQMQYEAVRWSKQAAHRYQWAARDADKLHSRKAAFDLLNSLGISEEELRKLAKKDIIQVCIPWHATDESDEHDFKRAESDNWEERIMPWEMLLLQAIRALDASADVPCVVRQLRMIENDEQKPTASEAPGKVARDTAMPQAMLIINSPERGHEAQLASFCHERDVLTRLLKPQLLEGDKMERTDWCGRDFLNQNNAQGSFLHLMAAQDVQMHGTQRITRIWLPHTKSDLSGAPRKKSSDSESVVEWADYEAAGSILGRARPSFLGLSFENSGPRLGALAVARGAQAAIGFQDSISEGVRVNFFSRLYEKLVESDGEDLAGAFKTAIREVSYLLRGTGVILWSRQDLVTLKKTTSSSALALEAMPAPVATLRRGKKAAPKLKSKAVQDQKDGATAPPSGASPVWKSPTETVESNTDILTRWQETQQDIRPKPRLNYAMMHNQPSWEKVYPSPNPNGPLFDAFTVRCPAWYDRRGGSKPMAHVRVTLHSGDVSTSWSRLVPLGNSTPLAREIRVPLTSVLARTLRESIHSLVDMEILVDGKQVFHQCDSITLLAVDEWQDDGLATFWLPSFVQPRDPAIRDLIRDARHILGALADDFHAAFDGYQSDDSALVDRQVQAIWAAIMQLWRPAYINPPPSFTEQSQRLRRPGDILAERAGTCIDLALLLAAALEYIDIEPLVILAPGHAYVAYCRQPREAGAELFTKNNVRTAEEEKEAAFSNDPKAVPVALSEADATNTADAPASGERNLPPWAYDQRQHRQIVKALKDGKLAALEATYLTRLMPFSVALAEGARKLSRRVDFDCLLDVRSARQCHVTPLPLIYEPVK